MKEIGRIVLEKTSGPVCKTRFRVKQVLKFTIALHSTSGITFNQKKILYGIKIARNPFRSTIYGVKNVKEKNKRKFSLQKVYLQILNYEELHKRVVLQAIVHISSVIKNMFFIYFNKIVDFARIHLFGSYLFAFSDTFMFSIS